MSDAALAAHDAALAAHDAALAAHDPALAARLAKVGTLRLLVLGDIMLDAYWRGEVVRLSPEAPVPILQHHATQHVLGGAANVAANLVGLGCQVYLLGVVGDDAAAATLRQLLAQQPQIDSHGVLTDATRPTTQKLRMVASGQQMVRVDQEVQRPLSATLCEQLLTRLQQLLPQVDGVICSDYAKGCLSVPLLQAVLQASQAAQVPLWVDPKGNDFSRYRGAAVLTPNQHELAQATGLDVRQPAALAQAAAQVLQQTQARGVLVTCGAQGMQLHTAAAPPLRIPTQARDVFDVTGAGDTVIAALAVALCSHLTLPEAAYIANCTAGLAVGKWGTAVVSHAELQAQLSPPAAAVATSSLSLAQALQQRQRLRQKGQRLVFTNGCFDLLHAGHVHYLQQARALGDCLWVGLNSDSSIRQLKGPKRPLLPEAERLVLLTALRCVDAVLFFDAPTPAELIASLQPDVLVKGEDYRDRLVVGRDVVEAYGGRVALMPCKWQRSTTALVQSIVARYTN